MGKNQNFQIKKNRQNDAKKKRQKEKQQSLTQCIKDYSYVKNILINQFKFCKRTNDNTCI